MQPNILTVCAIEAGDVGNVIPDRCVFRGSLRTLDEGSRNRVLERLRETTDLIARAQRCTSKFTVLGGTPCAENRPDVSAWVRESLVALLGKERIRTPVMTSMGSEDFSQISSRIPACYMSISSPLGFLMYCLLTDMVRFWMSRSDQRRAVSSPLRNPLTNSR